MLRRQAIGRMLTGAATGWGVGSSIGQVLGRMIYGKPKATPHPETHPYWVAGERVEQLHRLLILKHERGQIATPIALSFLRNNAGVLFAFYPAQVVAHQFGYILRDIDQLEAEYEQYRAENPPEMVGLDFWLAPKTQFDIMGPLPL